jgi:type I restriction enzyme S subunit
VKTGWQTTPFEDCIEQVTYTTKIQRKDFLNEGTFPIVSQEEDLINGRWENEADLFKVERPLVLFGDHTRSFKYVDFDFVLGADGVKILKPKTFLHPRYFYFQLQTAKLESLGYARHFRLLKEHSVSYPDFAEQHRIVTLLDEAFADIATAKTNAEKNLQNARELLDNHLKKTFATISPDWKKETLQSLCEKITDGTHQTPTYFESGVIFLSSRNVTSGEIDWENIKYIDEKQHLEMHRRVAPKIGDILLAKNGTTGVAAMVDKDAVFDIYVSLALIRSLGAIRPKLLLHFINSPAAKKQFNKRLKGTGVPNLHLEEIRQVEVNFPISHAAQDRLVMDIEVFKREVQRLESIYCQKLTVLDDLKKSLLHQAFSGQL